jgi:WD40 repeat protein
MQPAVDTRDAGAPRVWPATSAGVGAAATESTSLFPSAWNASPGTANAARAFESCCRVLSNKANTALVAQLPLLQSGEVVDLTRNYIGAAGLQAVAVVLPLNPNVVELRAPRNGLSNDAVVIFCRAMREHTRLAVLDFSYNAEISLAGGLALLSLAQQLPSLREVKLDGTHVPPVVVSRLQRTLDANAARAAPRTSKSGSTATTISTISGKPSSAMRVETAADRVGCKRKGGKEGGEEKAEVKQRDRTTLSALEARVRAAVEDGYQLPPAAPFSGWRVLEVPILAPPFLFDTEVELLCTNVFPRLNREFASHQVILFPVVVVGATGAVGNASETGGIRAALWSSRGPSAPRTIGSYRRELHFLPVCDVASAVARGRFAAIELIGDRPGDYAQMSAAAMVELQRHYAASSFASRSERAPERGAVQGKGEEALGKDGNDGATMSANTSPNATDSHGGLQPVLYAAHEAALRSTQWLLIATRCETRALRVPAAFAPLLTADPSVAHPDRHRTVVRDIVYDDAAAMTGAGLLRKSAVNGGVGVGLSANNPRKPAETSTSAAGAPGATATDVARTLEWDYAAEEYQWKRHVAWRRHVLASAPVQELVLPQYGASFDCTDASGALRLKDLEAFQAGIYERLSTILRTCLNTCGISNNNSSRSAVVVREGKRGVSTESRDVARAADAAFDVHNFFHRMGLLKLWSSIYVQAVAGLSSSAIKKNVMNRIVLYAANPPSRNSLLLHSHDAFGLAMLMCRAANRLQSLQHAYTLALYSARSTVLFEEPTDTRSFIVHVVSQLTTDAAVLRYVYAEVDTERLSGFFIQLLSGTVRAAPRSTTARGGAATNTIASVITAAGLPEYVAQYVLGAKADRVESNKNNFAHTSTTSLLTVGKGAGEGETAASGAHAFVVLADAIDKLEPPILPCGALVHNGGGGGGSGVGGGGNRAEPAKWSDDCSGAGASGAAAAPTPARTSIAETCSPLDAVFPRALARNVRLIASCSTDSAAFSALRYLGRDSVEALGLGPVSANEVEQYLSANVLSRMGLTFSEDDFECARAKKDAALGEYMCYLQDAARGAHEAPGFLTQSQVIQTFPETMTQAAQGVYDRLVRTFGLPLTRNVLGFLTASRWGLTIPELRALLPQLSACRLQKLLRLLRPVLEPEAPQEASVVMGPASGNAQLGTVRVLLKSFLSVVHCEALQMVTDEQQVDNDQRVWHTQLAQYYLSIVHNCLNTGAGERNGARCTHDNDSLLAAEMCASSRASCNSPELLAEQRRAMKEVVYHIAQSGSFWPQLDVTILSLPFMQTVYVLGLGYAYLRDLTAAFNERYKRHLLGEDIGEASWLHTQQPSTHAAVTPDDAAVAGTSGDGVRYALPAVLTRMRDYVRFAHDYGLLLSLRPSLVTQTALQIPAVSLNSVQRDAVTFLYRQLQNSPGKDAIVAQGVRSLHRSVYFVSSLTGATAGSSGKGAATHLGPVTCAVYLPNRKFVVTASRDRSLAWVNPQSGVVTWYARQPTAPVQSLTVCRTSAYVAAISEDRAVWIYDGLQGKLVTQFRGSEWFDSPIASVAFSARGRYLWVVTTDTRARCFECETGHLRCTLGVQELLEKPKKRTSQADTTSTTAGTVSDAARGCGDSDDKEGGGAHVEMVQCSATEWRRRRNYLSVLPDLDEDEVCTTVVAHEVRQWQLHPWKSATMSDVAVSADVEEKAKDTLVDFDLLMHGRLLPAGVSKGDKASAVYADGYKWLVPWQASASQHGGSSRFTCAFALPASCTAEVHLLALPLAAASTTTTAVAVRCAFAASSSNDEVTAVRAAPDGCWLSVGTARGTVALFNVGAAFQEWDALFLAHASDACTSLTTASAVTCEPSCVFTGLMAVPGLMTAPIRALNFHRGGALLFALGRSLQCWRVPTTTPGSAADETREVGEYVWAQAPTCLTVLPPPVAPSSDVELPPGIAELCVGDETGRLTLLKLWKPEY